MLSPLAKEDLQDLRDEGLQPTDEDVVRLNALALRLTDGPETTAACAPRFATCGRITFWEPTCAAWEFYARAKTLAADEDTEQRMFAFACANGRKPGFLESLTDRDSINLALGRFLASLTMTWKEVERAVYYCATGYDDATAEPTDLKKKAEAEKTRAEIEDDRFSVVEERIREAAATTGLSMADILAQTPTRLLGMIRAANISAGMEMTRNTAREHAEYLATLNAVRKRLIAERNAKDSAVVPPNQKLGEEKP